MNNLEEKLHGIQKNVTLSASEKAQHRASLLTYMHTSKKPVVSPFSFMFMAHTRYAAFALLVLVMGSGGVVAASESALPGNPLYGIKLQVAEPTRIALARDRKEKAELEVAFADRRLREFAVASVGNKLDIETVQLISTSLADRLEGAQEGIDQLQESGQQDEAYVANEELRSLITTHTKILKKVAASDANREAALAVITEHLSESLTDSSETDAELATSVATDSDIATSIEETQNDVFTALTNLREDITEASTTLDSEDHTALTTSIDSVTVMLDAAAKEGQEGDTKEALKLYSKADGRLDGLRTLIESERTLGIDLIDAESTKD